MRSFLLAVAALSAFAGTMTVAAPDAHAVVCARGIARAGCVATPAARGAVVVAKPVVRCTWVVVNGVRVKRCV